LFAYYTAAVRDFLQQSPTTIFGVLSLGNRDAGFSEVSGDLSDSWKLEIEILQKQLSEASSLCPILLNAGLLLEYPIPRRQRRIDVVLLVLDRIVILEFKSGEVQNSAAARQVEDYALDLSYFHEPSRGRAIVPIVVSPSSRVKVPERRASSCVLGVGQVPPDELASLLCQIAEFPQETDQLDLTAWNQGRYEPVPSVVEAATALYAGMSVAAITRSHSDVENLTRTQKAVLREVENARTQGHKVICFITGIPGAGKTLAGLNLAHSTEIRGGEDKPAVFMSGNRPLVLVLREALARDFKKRDGEAIGDARERVAVLIQNIHHFIGDNLLRSKDQLPFENVIVFDEAQRAWSAEHNQDRHKDKKSPLWHLSEPEMLLNIMDRHPNWAVIIALVGGGQEIHKGEAGLAEWGKALDSSYQHWRVVASSHALRGGPAINGTSLFGPDRPANVVIEDEALHLKTCLRAHQAEGVVRWVNYALAGDVAAAADVSRRLERFPVVLTRDLSQAKSWLRENTRGQRRCGLIASSGAARLRAHGIEISTGFRRSYPYERWFLDEPQDYRSSYQLEVPATEFEIQGLEIDIACLCWGGDFVWEASSQQWCKLRLVGSQWRQVIGEEDSIQVENKYRVLMTRAREGLLIFVPEGSSDDATQDTSAMNDTAQFLLSCGVRPLHTV
jgi:schlafen family protein